MEDIKNQLQEFKQATMNLKEGEYLSIPANIYIEHVEKLLKQLDEAKRKSDHWELEYYRK